VKPLHRILVVALCALSAACASPSAAAPTAHRVPASSATALDGRTIDVERELAAGRTVVLVFWQTWCGPCLAEAPKLREAARRHAGELSFVGVVSGPDGVVDDAELARVVARLELPYVQLRDRDSSWSRAFEVSATPTLIALRVDGSEGWRAHRPPDDWLAVHRGLRAGR